MNENKHIPQGYKNSPLGIIPEEWEVKRLGEVCTFLRNYTLSRNQLNDIEGQVQNIHYGDVLIKYPYIIDCTKEAIPYINQEDYKKTMGDFIKNGDIVMADTAEDGTVGKACEIISVDSKKILAGLHTMLFRPQKGLFSSQFLGYQINSILYRKQLYPLIQGIKVCSIGKQTIAKTFLSIPSFLEQQRIVSIISLWDTAIEKQSALIEKLKLRKRALMQQLLTSKKRLPGFSGEWREVKLGDVSTILRNNTLSRDQLNDNDGIVNNIHYGDVLIKYPSILDCQKEKLQYINNDISIHTDYIENGDIIMSDTAEDETVGRVCEVQNVGNKKILAGLHTMLIRPHKELFAPYYLGYYLNSEAYHKQLIPLIQGIKVCSIGKFAVQNTVLSIPSLKEQTAIASVLIKTDKEIELANEKLANLQSQKRGLMQQLLTGKKRIIK